MINTNENFTQEFIDRTNSIKNKNEFKNINIYKLLSINGFGIYFNTNIKNEIVFSTVKNVCI